MSSSNNAKLHWCMVTMLGVSLVIAGQFSGWNLGLEFGWANMVVGTVIMFLFYMGFLQLISEMGSTWPSAGGLAKYTALAFGNIPGGMINVSMAITLTAGLGIVGEFISSYGESLLRVNSFYLKIALFSLVLAFQLYGTKESMWVVLVSGLIAVVTLVLFSSVSLPHLQFTSFLNESSTLSLEGVANSLPFALWLFVGVEQTVIASEDIRNPAKDLPKGLLLALLVLGVTAFGVLIGAPSLAGVGAIKVVGDPLLAALDAASYTELHMLVGVGAVVGLVAGFFSLTYSASRQIYDLSRNQFFPRVFNRMTSKGVPAPALGLAMVVGFLISFVNPQQVILGVVLLVTGAQAIVILSYLRLRHTKSECYRGYNAKGGRLCGYLTLFLSSVIFYSCFSADLITVVVVFVMFLVVVIYHLQARKAGQSVVA